MQGKLIVLEGGDGSGKATQTELLRAALSQGGPVTVFDFPQYNVSVYGALLGRALNGEFGDFTKLSPYLASLPYSLDRATVRDDIINALAHGHVVCNRYTPSNMAFQAAKVPREQWDDVFAFIERGEYDELGLPKPDLVLYLNVFREQASLLVEKKQNRSWMGDTTKDLHEQNLGYQTRAAAVYRALARQRDDWVMIECMEGGRLQSRELIHRKVMDAVRSRLRISV